MDILQEIKFINEYFVNLKANLTTPSGLEAIDKIINIFSSIINENNQEKTHKNIGTKMNKFNYEKYIHCKNALDEINEISKDIENIKLRNMTGNLVLRAKIERLQEVKKQVIHKISTYEKSKKA